MELDTTVTKRSNDGKFSFTASAFHYVRLLCVVGAIYPGENPTSRGRIRRTLMKTFVAVLQVVIFIDVAFFIASLYYRSQSSKDFGRHSAFAIISVSYMVLSVLSSIVAPASLEKLEARMSRYEGTYGLAIDTRKWLKRWKATTIVLILTYITTPFMTISTFKDQPELICDLYPICDVPHSFYIPALIISGCTSFAGTSIWVGSFTVGVFLILVQLKEYKALNREFENLANLLPDVLEERFEYLVDKHEAMADIVQATNTFIRGFNFLGLFLTIPVNCVMMYSVITREITLKDIQFLIAGMGIGVFSMGMLLFLQARVSSHANAALEHLWPLGRVMVTEKASNSLSLLVCRLSRCPIAYDIYELISINMSSLLAIFGTFATYVIVVIQFQPTNTESCCERILRNATIIGANSTLCSI